VYRLECKYEKNYSTKIREIGKKRETKLIRKLTLLIGYSRKKILMNGIGTRKLKQRHNLQPMGEEGASLFFKKRKMGDSLSKHAGIQCRARRGRYQYIFLFKVCIGTRADVTTSKEEGGQRTSQPQK